MRMFTLFALVLLAACGPRAAEEPSPSSSAKAAQPGPDLPRDQAGEAVRRAIAYHGGWDAWAGKRTVEFQKTTTRYRPDGTAEAPRTQYHRYGLRPELKARIEWDDAGRKVVLVNSGGEAWKTVDGKLAASPEDRNQARNSTFGSHYVFNMPWKLADPGAHLAYAGRESLTDGTAVDKVRVTYARGTGDAGGLHAWTYLFDVKTGRLTANLLSYGPGKYDYTEYRDDHETGGLRFAARRLDFEAGEKGKRGPKASEIVYQDIRFDVPLPDGLFQRPRS